MPAPTTLPVIVKNFRPFDQLTPKQQREHLTVVHRVALRVDLDISMATIHDDHHSDWDGTDTQPNQHTHTKKAPRTKAGAR